MSEMAADGAPVAEAQTSEASLEVDEVEALLRDVSALGQGLSVRVKRSSTGHATPGEVSVDVARLALAEMQSVQLRYHFSGQAFVDTLMPLPGGRVRLFRSTL